MIESTPKAVAHARCVAAFAYLSEVQTREQMEQTVAVLDAWENAAGTDGEAAARQAVIDLAVTLMRERGGCQGAGQDMAVLVAYVLHLLFPEDEPKGFREHWRDSAGQTWDDGTTEPATPEPAAPMSEADLFAYWEGQLSA